MNISFTWKGSEEDLEGLAVFKTEHTTYEILLPSFKRAVLIQSALEHVYGEGRRFGQQEVQAAIKAAYLIPDE
ncbi:MAG: hypothetical protein RBR82_06345 [Pseudomonas sp.]|nr:hypothetical protein [Pseudomonas sp.]